MRKFSSKNILGFHYSKLSGCQPKMYQRLCRRELSKWREIEHTFSPAPGQLTESTIYSLRRLCIMFELTLLKFMTPHETKNIASVKCRYIKWLIVILPWDSRLVFEERLISTLACLTRMQYMHNQVGDIFVMLQNLVSRVLLRRHYEVFTNLYSLYQGWCIFLFQCPTRLLVLNSFVVLERVRFSTVWNLLVVLTTEMIQEQCWPLVRFPAPCLSVCHWWWRLLTSCRLLPCYHKVYSQPWLEMYQCGLHIHLPPMYNHKHHGIGTVCCRKSCNVNRHRPSNFSDIASECNSMCCHYKC